MVIRKTFDLIYFDSTTKSLSISKVNLCLELVAWFARPVEIEEILEKLSQLEPTALPKRLEELGNKAKDMNEVDLVTVCMDGTGDAFTIAYNFEDFEKLLRESDLTSNCLN